MATNPEKLDGHRRQLQKARDRRRAGIFERTVLVMTGMDAAGAIVNEQIVLHRPAANTVVTLVNSTAESIESFHRPLGIESSRAPVTVKPWGEAVRDPAQLKTAGKELRDKALVGVGALGAIGLTVATMARSGSKSS